MQTRKRWKAPKECREYVVEAGEPSSSDGFPLPAGAFDLESFLPDNLRTEEECAFAMCELEKLIAVVGAEIRRAHETRWRTGFYADRTWYNDAQQKWKAVKVARVLAQERRGALKRERMQGAQEKIERRFMDAAMTVLSKEQIQTIWDAVHADDTPASGS